ncbi:uncharacterized protein PSFLO_06346 [Pseudozyma flocculosa]|uniref:Uncharacterized protein n=1 Tax=Pseudozyma flocculosa TaxID=84751 RepID=A0A5C3F8R8_9BASI|nr:uncharacterized protein PSFLO_06346 [Pseudozyma flocculosa]
MQITAAFLFLSGLLSASSCGTAAWPYGNFYVNSQGSLDVFCFEAVRPMGAINWALTIDGHSITRPHPNMDCAVPDPGSQAAQAVDVFKKGKGDVTRYGIIYNGKGPVTDFRAVSPIHN